MKGIFKNIAIALVLIAFLVSALGFQLIRHTCPSCNIVEYYLYQPNACCGEHSQPADSEPGSCCAVPDAIPSCSTAFETTSCCEYQSEYFVVDELVYPQSLKVGVPLARLPAMAVSISVPEDNAGHSLLAAFLHPPPPVFSGTDYLFFIHQLKIDFC